MPQNVSNRWALVFWGLLLVGVDLKIRRFDILPDFAGYALIALGAGGLAAASGQFAVARRLSWVLVPVSAGLLLWQGSFSRLGWMLSMLLDGAMVWFLLGGIIDFTRVMRRSEEAIQAALCRLGYIGLICVSVVIGWIAALLPWVASILGTASHIASLVLLAFILRLVHRVKTGAAATASQPEELKDAA